MRMRRKASVNRENNEWERKEINRPFCFPPFFSSFDTLNSEARMVQTDEGLREYNEKTHHTHIHIHIHIHKFMPSADNRGQMEKEREI